MYLLRKWSLDFSRTLPSRKAVDGGFDVADEPEVDVGAAADVFRVLVDLDFFYTFAGEEF